MIAFAPLTRISVFSLLFLLSSIAWITPVKNNERAKIRVLIFFKTVGYYHQSIPAAVAAIQHTARAEKIIVDTTRDADQFTKAILSNYNCVVFLSTSGDVLNEDQQKALQEYVEQGGGFAGIHSVTDTEYDWPWFGKLVGAWFAHHPEIQEAKLDITDRKHPATKHLPDTWIRKDEWYNFKNLDTALYVLIKVDESSYKGGRHGENHPVAWCHEVGKGKSFYTSGGHTVESYADPLFQQHIIGGIRYAARRN